MKRWKLEPLLDGAGNWLGWTWRAAKYPRMRIDALSIEPWCRAVVRRRIADGYRLLQTMDRTL